ncbi:MAG: Ig-like domain-containing protein, partial [Actinomycetota bacterium]|nr:Ig-like domain-containing protein [Actinomycetota bacterium]
MRVLPQRRSLAAAAIVLAGLGVATHGGAQAEGTTCDPLAATRVLNSAPLAMDDEIWVQPGELVHLDVIANDTDFDGDQLTLGSITTPSSGTASIEDDQVVFIADATEGSVNFQYQVSDGACGVDNATIRVTVSK